MAILNPIQKQVLNQIKKSSFLRNNFYFTGGTVLSEFYLQHRYSDDLDFFSENKFDFNLVLQEVGYLAKKFNITFTHQLKEVVDIYILNFGNTSLKIDFGYYPFKRIEKGRIIDKLTVDSFTDIAVNKLAAINQRSAVKDFVDLYFILETKKLNIWDLMEGIKIKFRMEIDPWLLASDLAYASKNFTTLPKIIKPLTLNQLKNYFTNLAKKLGAKVFE